ncbi:MFS transporter [Nonomuraea longicatena]|uniref:MFS transporter n=1 Tax=Nonomuraea longicatena TaxID=83682 RepID=A0ABP3ZNU9_9ACTN
MSQPRAGVREWVGLAVLTMPVFLLSVDLTALHLALPHLAADLGATGTQQLWILDIYGFLTAGLLITMGTLGDRIGRRRLLLIGAAAFGLASVAAAFSTSAEMLIVTRALLGVAGATLMPSTLALISNMFQNDRQRGLAIGVWGSCFAVGGALGPVLSGILLEWFWWGSVFLLGVPAMVVLLLAGPMLLPEFRDPEPGRLDPLSVVLSLLAILPLVYALKTGAKEGWQPSVPAGLVIGVVAAILFVRRQRGLAKPLMDLSLFRHRVFSVGLGSMAVGQLVQAALILFLAQYLQLVQGMSPLQAGLWMVPFAAANVIGSMGAPALAARIGTHRAVAYGLVLMAVGWLLFTLAQSRTDSGPALAVIGAMVISIGIGPLLILVLDRVIAVAPREKSGAASSLSETSSEVGMALGVATLGSLVTAVYRGGVEVPAGVPEPVAAAARDNMPGALGAAQTLPADLGGEVLAAARAAFQTGLTVAGYTSIVIILVLAALTARYLRDREQALV